MKRVTGLHVIVGSIGEARTLELARIAQHEGAAAIQFRNKESGDKEFQHTAGKLRTILTDTTFIINDRAEIAYSICADGVHLGQDDLSLLEARELLGPDAIIGLSTSSLEQALTAERVGANYIGFGHMFPTHSKDKPSQPRTLEELRGVIEAVAIPVIAIGGINDGNLNELLMPGLGGIAVISAITHSKNPRATIRHYVKLLEERHAAYA